MSSRRISVFCAIISIMPVISSANEKLNTLREQRDAAIDRVVAPVNSRYVEAMQRLVKLLTTSGDLESALIVSKEIKRVKTEPAKEAKPLTEPRRLAILSEQRSSAIARAVGPIHRVYAEEVKQLFESARRSGSLEEALVFEKEMALISNGNTGVERESREFSEESLLGTVWGYPGQSALDRYRFEPGKMKVLKPQPDGTFIEGHYRIWKIHDPKRREIIIVFNTGEEILEVNSRMNKMSNNTRVIELIEEEAKD